MRANANGLRVEVGGCPSLGSSECPSMASSFSPLESPTPTPSSIYSHHSLASPGWHDPSFASHGYEPRTGSTPLRSSFRLADLTNDGMSLPMNMDGQDRMPVPDYLSGYDENPDQFWLPSDIPKTYDTTGTFPCPPSMNHYAPVGRHQYFPRQPYLPESATNPCLSRPIFNQPERMPQSASMGNFLPWLPPSTSMDQQTITPSQAFPGTPMTPPPSFSEFPPLNTLKPQTPVTPVRSCSFSTPSGPATPMSRLSGGHTDSYEEFPISPAYRDTFHRQPQQSRKLARRHSTKPNMSLDNLPVIIKQVQFKCKEPGCKSRFKRQEHLKRHMKSHSREKPHVCWVPGCQRAFSRSDNLNAHYTKTHSKRGGRNRYVATLDETSPDYDPDFRGQLTSDGRPIYGSKLEDPVFDRELSVDFLDD